MPQDTPDKKVKLDMSRSRPLPSAAGKLDMSRSRPLPQTQGNSASPSTQSSPTALFGDTMPETGALGQMQANLPEGAGPTLGAAFSGTAHFIKDILGGNPQMAMAHYIADPMKQEANVGRQLMARGDALSRFAGMEHRVASWIPVFGPMAGQAMEQIAKGDLGGGIMQGVLATGAEEGARRAPDVANAAIETGKGISEAGGFGKEAVSTASQRVLNQEMAVKKIQLGNVIKATGDEIGKHVEAIHEADHADLLANNKTGAISATRTLNGIGPDLDTYRAGTQAGTPVGQAIGMLERNPELTFSQAKDIRTSVGNMAYQTAKDSRDAAILKGIYGDLSDQMKSRSGDLGLSDSYSKYNTIHSIMSDHTHNFLQPLLDTTNGQDFFNALKEPRNADMLGQFTHDLAGPDKYGLDPNWMDSSNVDKILRYANRSNSGMGRLGAITKNPVAGGAGFVLGGEAGKSVGSGFLGSLFAANFMADMSQRVSALRQIGKLGVPDFKDQMPGPSNPVANATAAVSSPPQPGGAAPQPPSGGTPPSPAGASMPISHQIQAGIAKMIKMAAGGSEFGDLEQLLQQHKQDTENFLSKGPGDMPPNGQGAPIPTSRYLPRYLPRYLRFSRRPK